MVSINTKFRNRARPWGTTARSNRIGVSIHHTVTAEGKTRAQIESQIAGIQRAKPYGTYGWFVDYTGAIYEHVGIDGIGGAVGGANTPWLAIAYIGDGRYNFTREAERSIRMMVEYLDGLCGKRLQVKGHGQINATACPGTLIQRRINAGAFTQRYSKAHIHAVQVGLLKLGYDLGPWGADSDWGAMLSIATGQFQRKHGLLEDEIPGPATLAKINAEVAKLGTPKPPVTPPVTPPALNYVRWDAPVEMAFTKATNLYDFGENAPVAGSSFAVGERITIVGEVQEEGATYLMTDYSFADADTSKSPKFTRGILADTVEVYVEPEPDVEPEEPHPEPEPGTEEPNEPTPEPEPQPGSKAALAAIVAAIVAALGALVAWLNGSGLG